MSEAVTDSVADETVAAAAGAIYTAFRGSVPIAPLRLSHPEGDAALAYAIQDANTTRWLSGVHTGA